MAAMLEIFPIPGITDFKLVPAVPSFSIDPTGIPLMIILFGFGFIYSFIALGIVGIAIGYRNPIGATFKVLAESYTVFGALIGYLICKKLNLEGWRKIVIYVVPAAIFRGIGMYYTNIILLPILTPTPVEAAVIAATILIPWNMLQAVINIVVGGVLFYIIPLNLRREAGMGEFYQESFEELRELDKDEIEPPD